MRRPPRVMPALVTPFDRNGSVDVDAHRHNVEVLTGRGIAGFLIGGSTGEGPYLERGERRLLVEEARKAAPASFLMCGVAAETERRALSQLTEAAEGGADAALVLTPTALIRGRHELVARHYRDLARTTPLPLLLYSVPSVTGYELPAEVAVNLSALDAIVGMKDSGGHPVRASQVAREAGRAFLLYAGATRAVELSVSGGAHGAITASANYLPKLVTAVVDGVVSGKSVAADQRRLTAASAMVEANGLAGTKAAAGLSGLRVGTLRRPLRPVPAAVRRRISESIAGLA